MNKVIICNRFGQLGNSLFMFAGFIGNSIENNYQVINLEFYEYARYFENCCDRLIIKYPEQRTSKNLMFLIPFITKFVEKFSSFLCKFGTYVFKAKILTIIKEDIDNIYHLNSKKFESIALKSNTTIIYARANDDINRNKHSDEIRKFFRLTPIHKENVAFFIHNARKKCEILIGIHVRLGDYRTYDNGKYCYSLLQYAAVMKNISTLFPDKKVCFLICSNESLDTTSFKDISFIIGPNHIIEDMYCLTKCDYITGPPSTYTMWASFYGEVPLHMLIDIEQEITVASFSVYL